MEGFTWEPDFMYSHPLFVHTPRSDAGAFLEELKVIVSQYEAEANMAARMAEA